MTNLDDWLVIGRIVAPQGLNGELRVYPMSDFPERFLEPGERWVLRPHATDPEPIQLLSGRFIGGKGLYVLELEGVSYRDQAERLRDAMLLVPISDRPILEDDEYHVLDLIGIEVVDHSTGKIIGTIKDVIPAGNDLLEVELVPAPNRQSSNTSFSDIPSPETSSPETSSPDISSLNIPSSDATSSHSVDNLDDNHPKGSSTFDAPIRTTIDQPVNTIVTSSDLDNSKENPKQTQSLRKKGRRSKVKHAKKKKQGTKVPTVLIPFVPEIVPVVDLEAGRVAIAPPPGLLEDLSE